MGITQSEKQSNRETRAVNTFFMFIDFFSFKLFVFILERLLISGIRIVRIGAESALVHAAGGLPSHQRNCTGKYAFFHGTRKCCKIFFVRRGCGGAVRIPCAVPGTDRAVRGCGCTRSSAPPYAARIPRGNICVCARPAFSVPSSTFFRMGSFLPPVFVSSVLTAFRKMNCTQKSVFFQETGTFSDLFSVKTIDKSVHR